MNAINGIDCSILDIKENIDEIKNIVEGKGLSPQEKNYLEYFLRKIFNNLDIINQELGSFEGQVENEVISKMEGLRSELSDSNSYTVIKGVGAKLSKEIAERADEIYCHW